MSTLITKKCGCGADVEVEQFEPGSWAARLGIDFGAVCSACAAKAAEEQTEREREADEERRVAAIASRRRFAQMPVTLRGVGSWDSLGALTPSARDSLVRWANGEIKGVLLSGPVGVGKTFAAAVAAWEFLARRQLVWTSAPVLFARLGSGFGSPQRDMAVDVLMGGKPLVLDDLDKSRPTEYGAEQIFLAIDQRVTNNVPLLVTTNLSLAEIANRMPEPFGEAISSRLAGYCETHKLDGHDRRLN